MRLGEVVGERVSVNTTPDEIVSLITGAVLVNRETNEEDALNK